MSKGPVHAPGWNPTRSTPRKRMWRKHKLQADRANTNGLMPKYHRSQLGATRYYPRCANPRCGVGLPKGQHIGLCERCDLAEVWKGVGA